METLSYKVLDLFCGAGGLSLGFKNAGFIIAGGVDFNKAAMDTHNANFNTKFHYCGDIQEISDITVVNELNDIDVIIGGPPCQGFSSANRYTPIEDDPRNKLFLEYMRFVRLIKPSVFVIENVQGILTRDNGYAKNKILEITTELGYNVSVSVLNAYDYGVPQTRKRAFFVGIRNDLNKAFNFDSIQPKFTDTTVFDAIGDLEQLENKANFNTLKEILRSPIQNYYYAEKMDQIANHDISTHSKQVVERMKFVPQGGNWRDIPDSMWDTQRNNRHSSAYRRLSYNKPSITIDTGHMNYFHPIFHRVPTVRESARIQTFTDSFVFLGSKTDQFRQVGNAVPAILSECIASAILSSILGG